MGKQTTNQNGIPSSPDAERAVLGSILMDNRVLGTVLEILGKDQFYAAGHRIIFGAVSGMIERHRSVDLVTLVDALGSAGALKQAGGASYIAGLVDGVPMGNDELVRDPSDCYYCGGEAADHYSA